jgi:hypothetical protein
MEWELIGVRARSQSSWELHFCMEARVIAYCDSFLQVTVMRDRFALDYLVKMFIHSLIRIISFEHLCCVKLQRTNQWGIKQGRSYSYKAYILAADDKQ